MPSLGSMPMAVEPSRGYVGEVDAEKAADPWWYV